MNFRKLLLCLIIGVLILNISNIKAYAAEEVTINQEQESTTEEVSIDNEETNQVVKDDTSQVIKEDTNQVVNDDTIQVIKEDANQEVNEETNKEVNDDTNQVVKEETKQVKEETKQVKEVTNKYTKAELRLLSALIYCEAQGESYNGKLAVGIVVMNRVRSDRYPDTLKNVIYQKYQFSPATNGTLKKALAEYDKGKFTSSSEKECIKAAKDALNGAKSITVNGKKKSFSKFLSFSGRLKGYTYKLGNHKFK
jgi:spore germination cell wall hydrolase CwlJ-like protein